MTDTADVFAKTRGSRGDQTELMRISLANALVLLMQEKPLDEITVSDIARRAGVSRMTYYRHFSTKEELLEYRLDDMFSGYCKKLMGCQRVALRDFARGFCDCFYENRGFLETLCRGNASGIIHERLLVYLDELGARVFGNPRALQVSRYESACMAGCLYGVLIEWTKGGFEEPRESIVEAICRHSRYSTMTSS